MPKERPHAMSEEQLVSQNTDGIEDRKSQQYHRRQNRMNQHLSGKLTHHLKIHNTDEFSHSQRGVKSERLSPSSGCNQTPDTQFHLQYKQGNSLRNLYQSCPIQKSDYSLQHNSPGHLNQVSIYL